MDTTAQPTPPPVSSPSTTTQPVQSVKPSHSRKGLMLVGLVAAVLLVVVAAAVYVFGMSNKPQTPVAIQVAPTAPHPNKNPTAEWRQMRMANWELKIPSGWFSLECSDDLQYFGEDFKNDSKGNCGFDGFPGRLRISKSDDFVSAKIPTNTDKSKDPYIENKMQMKVDGIDAIKQQETISDGPGAGTNLVVYIPSKKTIITLDEIDQIQTFDKILSTFRFTDSAQTVDTSTWKTYRNTESGYSFQYPADWENPSGGGEGCGPVFRPKNEKDYWLTICGPYTNSFDSPENLSKQALGSQTPARRENVEIEGKKGVRQEIETIFADKNYYQYEIAVYLGDFNVMVNLYGKETQVKGTHVVTFYIKDKALKDQKLLLFDQILSTLKFTQ